MVAFLRALESASEADAVGRDAHLIIVAALPHQANARFRATLLTEIPLLRNLPAGHPAGMVQLVPSDAKPLRVFDFELTVRSIIGPGRAG